MIYQIFYNLSITFYNIQYIHTAESKFFIKVTLFIKIYRNIYISINFKYCTHYKYFFPIKVIEIKRTFYLKLIRIKYCII